MPYKDIEKRRAKGREWMARRRAEAKATGELLPTNTWWERNRDRHRGNVRQWRADNLERSNEINRQTQAKRRSTPWGKINNRMWALVHAGVRADAPRGGKYSLALGYHWGQLRAHIEAQFTPDMNWGNWGEVWELDHIIPLSSYRYETIDCPTFKECWALSNLRPLCRIANAAKGNKV